MRMKFDEKMRESNAFFVDEQLAEETARRLAIANEFVSSPQLQYRPQAHFGTIQSFA